MLIKNILIFILAIIILIGLLLTAYKRLDQPVLKENCQTDNMELFEIKPGTTVKNLARMLIEKELISSKALFQIYLRASGKDHQIKSGFYNLPPCPTIRELGSIFTKGKSVFKKVTIPEGVTSWEIGAILAGNYPNFDTAVFDSLIHSRAFCQICSLDVYSLEGYLFPETYHLPHHKLGEAQAIKIMVNQFIRVIRRLNLAESPVLKMYNVHGLITLASIVEAEAKVKEEQKLIAGVFYNRLQQNWPLGADPTIRFALKKLEGPLKVSELKTANPYNTRIYPRLPPGPICSPGSDAIFAAAYPAVTDYMYFVAVDDGTGRHNFSKTNSEHVRNKEVRRQNQNKYVP